MANERFDDVWDAVGETQVEASLLKAKADLMRAIESKIRGEGWTQAEAARRLNVRQPRGKLYHEDKPCAKAKVEVAAGPIFELSVRLEDLGVKPHDPLHFAVEAMARKSSLDRAPREGSIELKCPTEDFELVMWQA